MKLSVLLAIITSTALAGASLSARAGEHNQTLSVSAAASTNQDHGGSSIEVTRTFNNGVSIGAFLDRVKDHEAGGLHLQSPKKEVVNLLGTVPVMGRIGLGVAQSSTEWVDTTQQQQQQQTFAGATRPVPTSLTTTGVERKLTPFLSGELSHDFLNGFEAFAGVKHFFNFAEHNSQSGKAQTFVNAGLRFTF